MGSESGEAWCRRDSSDQLWTATGTKAGYDLELTRAIAEEVSIPVIASGGAGNLEHFYDALTEGKQMQRWRHPYSITKSWRSGK